MKLQFLPLGRTPGIRSLCLQGGGWGEGIWSLYTYGVGNLNSGLDFLLHVPVIECGFMAEAKMVRILHEKIAAFFMPLIWSKGQLSVFLYFKLVCWLRTLINFLGRRHLNHLKWTYGGVFEQLFGQERKRMWSKIFSKKSNTWGFAWSGEGRGMLKLQFDWYITEEEKPNQEIAVFKNTREPM